MASLRKVKKPNEGGNSNGEGLPEKPGPHNDEEIQKALEEIDSYQDEIDTLLGQASEEMIKIEQKYNHLKEPLYAKRGEVIQKIPHFWVTAFSNHPDLQSLLGDAEEDCLHHLTKIEVEENPDIRSGYKINFHFEENPYFENSILTKEYHLAPIVDEPTTRATEIRWKEGYNLLQKAAPAKSSRKRSYEQKTFFTWFTDNSDPSSDDIAEAIKGDLWHNPISYFLIADSTDTDASEPDDDNEDGEEVLPDNTDEDTGDVLNSTED